VGNPAAGGGRWVEVAPERFATWAGAFDRRHGGAGATGDPAVLILTAADGAVAECHVPFPPMPAGPGETAGTVAEWAAAAAAHAAAARTVGVLLVRLGGYAAGVFAGAPAELVASKTGSRLVHGRSAAGGWSQHRFARRREKQAAEALDAAADAAVRVFGGFAGELDTVVLGGDRRTAAGLRDDPRLRPYLALATERFLTVPDPKLPVLRDSPRRFRAIRIRLTDHPPAAAGPPTAMGPLRGT
jgi:hypothetical protein